MTAATTSSNKGRNFFAVRFMNKLSEDMRFFIMNMVLQLLCLPLLVGVVLKLFYHMQNMSDTELIYNQRSPYISFSFIGFIAFALSMVLGVVIPMVNFRYLYSKPQVDMNYSLPLNNRQRFCADFFSGLIVFIVPTIIGAAIAGIEYFIGSRFIDMSRINEYMPDILRMAFAAFIGLIMFYTLSVFAMCFAGSLFESIFSIAAVNIAIPVFMFLTWLNIINAAHYGLGEDSFFSSSTMFTTSPFGVFAYVMHYIDLMNTGCDYSSAYKNTMFIGFVVKALLFSLLIFVFAFMLYKHRKAEDVSKPYVYNAFYYVIMAIAVYCIISALRITMNTSGFFIAAIILSGILWFVMEAIRRRGFKRFWTAAISFAAVCAAVVCIVKVIDSTKGLGFAKKLPSESDITDIKFSEWSDYRYHSSEGNYLIHDPQIINDVIELNNEIIDRHFDSEKYSYDLSEYNMMQIKEEDKENKKKYIIDERSIEIIYYTKSGREILRQYSVPSEMLTKLFCDIYTSKEYADHKSETLFAQSLTYNNDNIYNEPEDADACMFSIYDKTGNQKSLVLSVEEGKEMTEAIRDDIAAISINDLKNSEYYCSIDNQFITSSFENTIRFLENHDIVYHKTGRELVDEYDVYSDIMLISTENEYVFPIIYNEVNFKPDYSWSDSFGNAADYGKCAILDSILCFGDNNKSSSINLIGKHIEFSDPDAAAMLLDIASPIVVDEKIIAEITCGKTTLYICDRPGYREIVEKAKDTVEVFDNKTGEFAYDADVLMQQ